MISLGMSVLIKETWNRLCFGRKNPKPSWELSSWPTEDPCRATTVQVPTDRQSWRGDRGIIQKQSRVWILLYWSHKKNKPLPHLPTPKKLPPNRSGALQNYLACIFLSKWINRDGKEKGEYFEIIMQCEKCDIKMPQKVNFEPFRFGLIRQLEQQATAQEETAFAFDYIFIRRCQCNRSFLYWQFWSLHIH